MSNITLLSARTAAEVQAVLQRAVGRSDAMEPDHLVDVTSAGAVDLLGSWHVRSQGPTAPLVRGGLGWPVRAMRTVVGGASWRAEDVVPFNYSTGNFAVAFLARLGTGTGDWAFGNKNEEALGGAGWAISVNGDGGIGFEIGDGTTYLNVDTTGIDLQDGLWRWYVVGYRHDVAYGLMAWGSGVTSSTPKDMIVDTDVELVDVTSDGAFGLHSAASDNASTAAIDVARIISFQGSNALNLLTAATVDGILGAMNADLYPSEPLSVYADVDPGPREGTPRLDVRSLGVFDDNAGALEGGLRDGDLYRNTAGVILVCHGDES